MKKKTILFLLGALLTSSLFLSNVSAATPRITTTRMECLVNTLNGDVLYTVDQTEYNLLRNTGVWQDCGTWWFPSRNYGDPVFRLYNPVLGQHHYSMNFDEIAILQQNGWLLDRGGVPVWYSYGDTPVYRIYNPANCSHILTIDVNLYNMYANTPGFIPEGIVFYGYDL